MDYAAGPIDISILVISACKISVAETGVEDCRDLDGVMTGKCDVAIGVNQDHKGNGFEIIITAHIAEVFL